MAEILEKHFIHESNHKRIFSVGIWLFAAALFVLGLIFAQTWYNLKVDGLYSTSPFLRVTNRDMSLFLWQHPEFMRIHAKQKLFYLPAFKYVDKVTIDLTEADKYVSAPPEVLFRYHTWDRLIKDEFVASSIPVREFQDFLSYAPEWQPYYWKAAPKEYRQLIDSLPSTSLSDLSTLPSHILPVSVQMAFVGWRNYFKDGEAINLATSVVGNVRTFLSEHPHYSRSYWRNLFSSYLNNLEVSEVNETVSPEEISSFLRVALYNSSR